MSRSERRAYRRMTKNQDPYAPPAATAGARARMEQRQRQRRAANARNQGSGSLFGGRAGWIVFGGAAVAAILAFSLIWPSVWPAVAGGIGVGLAWLAITIGFLVLRRRAAAPPGRNTTAR
jgi:hypothetical protein